MCSIGRRLRRPIAAGTGDGMVGIRDGKGIGVGDLEVVHRVDGGKFYVGILYPVLNGLL